MRECVLVDLGNTLIHGPRLKEVFEKVVQSEKFSSRLRSDLRERLKISFSRIFDSVTALKRKLMIEVGLDTVLKLALKDSLIIDHRLSRDLKEELLKLYVETRSAYDDAHFFLKKLKTLGFTVVVVSNVSEHCMAVEPLGRLNLRDYVDEVVTSAQLGIRKPHPLIYRIAISKVQASSAVFVGDDVENDLLGPLNAGISAIHVARSDTRLKRSVSSLSEALDIILTGSFYSTLYK